MENLFDIAELIQKKITGTISEYEMKVLEKWLNESDDNVTLYEKAVNPENQLKKMEVHQLFDKEKAWSDIEEKIFLVKTIRFYSQSTLKFAAAILLPIMVFGGIAYLLLSV